MDSIPPADQALQAMGRTKGGLNTKIHALVNARAQALLIALSAGNDADISHQIVGIDPELIGEAPCS